MLKTARGLLEDPRLGALLVAESESDAGGEEGTVVGVLTASYQLALHVPGRYALIQDLWVCPAWRGRSVGRELLGALFELARTQGMARAEVGLPRESFAGIRSTEAFYAHNGFEHLGARMRRISR
jgi:GNAT superfamily N-acetyltransferase